MKKCILSFIIACLSLTSSLITIQAAAQNNLTEGQVRGIVTSMTHHNSSSSPAASPTSSLYGPRFEVIPMPNNISTWFKFDKETGDTWVVENKSHGTTSRQIRKGMSFNDDEKRPGEINYQLLINSWNHIVLLNVHTGTMWEAKYQRGTLFGDFKEIRN